MSTLREQVEALRHKDPENSGYAAAYSYGRNEALAAVVALIPEGAVLVTEESLALALEALDNGGDGSEYAHTWTVDSYAEFAAAIVRIAGLVR